MPVKIHGKDYRTVAERVELFHKNHKDAKKSIITEILHDDKETVMMKTTITVDESTYVGHAVETYNSSMINKTSAIENCETSAIGRALSSAGLGGTEFASANEVQGAIEKQKNLPKENKPAANNGASNGVPKVRNQNILTEENSANTPTDWNNGRESAINFGKHKGKKWREVPRDYLIWLAEGSDNEQWKAMANAEILLRVTEGAEKSEESKKETEKVVEEKQESMALATEDDDDLPWE
jgi:hypothetical protein